MTQVPKQEEFVLREKNQPVQLAQSELPFPYPLNTNPMTRTDTSVANTGYVIWNDSNTSKNINLKGKDVNAEHDDGEKNKIMIKDKVQKAKEKTKDFFGVESNKKKIGRSVNHWNERRFKLLDKDYSGLNREKMEKYLNEMRDKVDNDMSSPLLYYQMSNKQIIHTEPKKNVASIAMNSFKRVISSKNDDQVDNISGENQPGCWDAFTCDGERKFGIGFCDKFFDNDLNDETKKEYYELLKTIKSHRPYFTYWITFVQVLICLISIFTYGLAPFGFSYSLKKGYATTTNLEKRFITYPVKQNFWLGPEPMDLIHLGAKYAPCMRNDSTIYKEIKKDMNKESETACCIRNDRGGCVQTTEKKCTGLNSKFHKWNRAEYPSPLYKGVPRTSGSVCGLDPEFCPESKFKDWPDDITQWPICNKPTLLINLTESDNEKYNHMKCEIIGRPCCIGIQGECIITTLEHCTLMRGYFHENANLCSQVDCMQDVCGMIDFLNTKSPDQVYRLFTSIFINAGLLQLFISIIFNIFLLRDLEKLAGSLRIAIIYIGSGIIGNLGSAIFLPYQAEVGPFGSHFGIIAGHFVEAFHAWKYYTRPWIAFVKLIITLIIFFIIGLLPMIDNFANLFGFVSGLLLTATLFPNVDLKGYAKRTIVICVSVSLTVLLVTGLVIAFYLKPIDKCDACKFFSCPFGSKYCLEMDFDITRLKDL